MSERERVGVIVLDGDSIRELHARLQAVYGVEAETATDDVGQMLADLLAVLDEVLHSEPDLRLID